MASYTVAPALPAGLSLDASTGNITGTPSTLVAIASYAVTATNPFGSTTAILVISVNELPPAGLTYAPNPAVYTKGTAITPSSPSSTGGAVSSYAVAPALPAGLGLDTTTGVLSGTPTQITATASYTVTATNGFGTTNVAVSVTVNDAPPTGLLYATNPAIYSKSVAIAANTPTSGGGTVVFYAASLRRCPQA